MNDFDRNMAQSLAIGSPWEPLGTDHRVVTELVSRRITLHPHPTWVMPNAITWREDPFKEINWIGQFNSLRWLDPARRQADKGDLRGLPIWLEITESWLKQNPPGRGKNTFAWRDMIEAQRAMTMCFGLPMLQDHSPEHLPLILDALQQHGEWLEDPKRIKKGNHSLQQHQGLLIIGAVLKRPDWVQLATDRMDKLLRHAYDEQGVNEEGAIQYHQINYQWWGSAAKRMRVTGSVPESIARIEKAPLVIAHATRPDGAFETIGDTDVFRQKSLTAPETRWVASNGEDGAPPAEKCILFDAGYVFSRSGWGDAQRPFSEHSFYSVRFGPQNRIHGHIDGGALTLYSHEAPLLIDPGKLAYDYEDIHRKYLVSREAHNAVAVSGLPYDASTDVQLVSQSITNAGEDLQIEDRGYPGVVLRRRIIAPRAVHGTLLVIDECESDKPVTIQQRWHLHPDASHRAEPSRMQVLGRLRNARRGLTSVRIAQALDAPMSLKVEQGQDDPVSGWFSPGWRILQESRTVSWSAEGRSLRYVTLIRPSYESDAISVDYSASMRTLSWTAKDGGGKISWNSECGFEFEPR